MNSAGAGTFTTLRREVGMYFFLSYAHSVPISEGARRSVGDQPRGDSSVTLFFERLQQAVAEKANHRSGLEIGFYDQEVSGAADLKATLTQALGTAEVFVPLYSPGYVTMSWTRREEAAFRRRLALAGVVDPGRHVLPLLWTPIPEWWQEGDSRLARAVAAAQDLGAGIPGYADNGVRALCMLRSYRDALEAVLDRVSDRIVTVAERHAAGPSPAPDLDEVRDDNEQDPSFIVTVLAPTRAQAHDGDLIAESYGERSIDWRPFAGRHALPVADHTASTAERLGLASTVKPFEEAADLARQAPMIVLVDPWVMRVQGGENVLATASRLLPRWVLPLVVADRQDSRFARAGEALVDETVEVLRQTPLSAVDVVDSLDTFESDLPVALTRARRAHLKHGPVYPPVGDGARYPSWRDRHGPVPGAEGEQPR